MVSMPLSNRSAQAASISRLRVRFSPVHAETVSGQLAHRQRNQRGNFFLIAHHASGSDSSAGLESDHAAQARISEAASMSVLIKAASSVRYVD